MAGRDGEPLTLRGIADDQDEIKRELREVRKELRRIRRLLGDKSEAT